MSTALERVGIVGAGNVGSAVTMQLATCSIAKHVELTSRDHPDAIAALLDAASAFPDAVANHFEVVDELSGAYSVVVVAAGLQPDPGVSNTELLSINTEIVLQSAKTLDLGAQPILVVVGTPVDLVTERVQAELPTIRVIGFGGELDTARLRFVLKTRGIDTRSAWVIGEHGPRAIPVYDSEVEYQDVRKSVGSFLSTIKGVAPEARNLASGVQIVRLLRALGGRTEVQSISRVHPEYGVSLTWPWTVGKEGAESPAEVHLGPSARASLHELLELRQRARSWPRLHSGRPTAAGGVP